MHAYAACFCGFTASALSKYTFTSRSLVAVSYINALALTLSLSMFAYSVPSSEPILFQNYCVTLSKQLSSTGMVKGFIGKVSPPCPILVPGRCR